MNTFLTHLLSFITFALYHDYTAQTNQKKKANSSHKLVLFNLQAVMYKAVILVCM